MKNRKVVRVGSSIDIRLAPVDLEDYNIEESDKIDMEQAFENHLNKKRKNEK